MNIKTIFRYFAAVLFLLFVTFGIYSMVTYESPVEALTSRREAAEALTDKADQLSRTGSPLTGEAYLSAGRAWQEWAECLLRCISNHSLSQKERQGLAKELSRCRNIENFDTIIEECLEKAEEHGVDETELGKIFYDCGRMMLECSTVCRTQPRLGEAFADLVRETAIAYMRAARDKGNADADAFLKSEGFLQNGDE